MVSQYLTTQEVAAMFRTSPETVRYWRHVNAGPPSFKVGRRVLYDATGVERWLAEQQATSTARGRRLGKPKT